RVLAARLDVEVHLADLERPLDDRVQIFLLNAPVRAQAEVVRQLADVLALFPRVDDVAEQAVAELARLVEVLDVDVLDERHVVLVDLRAVQERVDDAMDVLRDRALLRARRLAEVLLERPDRLEDLLGRRGDLLELARRDPAVVADRRVADELADLLRVLRRDLRGALDQEPVHDGARVLERRQRLLLRPVVEAADPEVVVLVEVPLLALREEVAAAREAVLERGERLVTVDVDALRLGLDLVLETVDVLRPLLDVDRGDDRRGEVEDLFELARCDVEQVADAARHALEEPDVRDRRGEVDMTHALPAHLLPRHLDAAALADDSLVADALVLAAVALPVARRPEDALAEQAVALRLERAVVDRLRLRDLTRRPVADLLAGGKPDPNCVEIVDVDPVQSFLVFELEVYEVCVAKRSDFGVGLLFGLLVLGDLDVVEIAERLVRRQRQLTVLVDALLPFFRLLGGGLPPDR